MHNVVGDNTYYMYAKMGGSMQCAVTFWEAHIAKISLYKKRTGYTDSLKITVICVDILMRCAVNSIFDCAGVFATTYN